MGLTWWPLALAALAVLAGTVAAAVLRPGAPVRQARRLAHTDRLTELPEYVRLQRWRTAAAVTALLLTMALFGAAAVAAARPTGWGDDTARAHPDDVMLCVAAPAGDPASAAFFDYFSRAAAAGDVGRIGLTSPSARLIPLTRDAQFATERLGSAAALGARFSPVVDYRDYRTNVTDTLALCLSGFTADDPGRRRTLIYLGPDTPVSPTRTLVTEEQLIRQAQDSGVQVSTIAPQRDSGLLWRLAESTGGQSILYRPDQPDPVAGDIDRLRTHRAQADGPGAARIVAAAPDTPAAPLLAALAYAVALCTVRVWVS